MVEHDIQFSYGHHDQILTHSHSNSVSVILLLLSLSPSILEIPADTGIPVCVQTQVLGARVLIYKVQ